MLAYTIPAEQRGMLGNIEVNNHCWRFMWNRTVDARAVVTDDEVDDSIIGVTHAKNSLVK